MKKVLFLFFIGVMLRSVNSDNIWLPTKIRKYCDTYADRRACKKFIEAIKSSNSDPRQKRFLVLATFRDLSQKMHLKVDESRRLRHEILQHNNLPIQTPPLKKPSVEDDSESSQDNHSLQSAPIVLGSRPPETQRVNNPLHELMAQRPSEQRRAGHRRVEVRHTGISTRPMGPAGPADESEVEKLGGYMPETSFADVVGGVPAEIEDLKCILANDPDYVRVGVKKPLGYLFYGPTGTGKTLLARSLAGELKALFFSRSSSSFINKYVGTGANAIRQLFDCAIKEAQFGKVVLIYLDELDAIGQKRDGGDRGSLEADRTIIQLMTLMDGAESHKIPDSLTIIGATNRLESLDEALIRQGRFNHKIKIDIPDLRKRAAILHHYVYLRDRLMEEGAFNVEVLSRMTEGFNCAELEDLVNQTALSAARNRRAICGDDFRVGLEVIKATHQHVAPPEHMYN